MQELRILLVEDNRDDAEMICRLANTSDQGLVLDVAVSAEEALTHLRGAVNLPALIFVDLSLPTLSGLDFIREVKGDPAIREIPVIILSGSENDDDVRAGEELGAHSHFTKPISAQDLHWVTTSIRRYWERIAALNSLNRGAS